MPRAWRQAIRALALLIGLVLAGLVAQPIQAQDLGWAKQAGGALPNIGNAIAADGAGNTCVAGAFQGNATFGPHPANPTVLTLTSVGEIDIFVAKYDAGGVLLWAQQIGGAAADAVYGIALDGSGNCYVTGASEGSDGLADTFVAKVDASGALLWTRQTGGESESVGYAIAADGNGNSYVTGAFGGSAIFGLGETHETTLVSADSANIFVAKYDTDGALAWAKRTDGSSGSYNAGAGIAVDGSGNSYVTGSFEGASTFGPDETNQIILTSAGGADIFLAKVDTNGALLWAKQAGGAATDRGYGIALDGSGSGYITGHFQGAATFGPGELTSAGLTDIFVAKVDATGGLFWVEQAGGSLSESGQPIGVDGGGNSYVTGLVLAGSLADDFYGGSFVGSAALDAATVDVPALNVTTLGSAGGSHAIGAAQASALNGAGYYDTFVTTYDTNGALLRATGTWTAIEISTDIAVDGSGNSYVTGVFAGAATFGRGEANETTLTSVGNFDIFVAKYDAAGALLWASRMGGNTYDGSQGIAVDGSGNSYVIGSEFFVQRFEANFSQLPGIDSCLGALEFCFIYPSYNIFVAKYDAAGALLWTKRTGVRVAVNSFNSSFGWDIGVDGNGNSYITGFFNGRAIFGLGEANETTLTSTGTNILPYGSIGGSNDIFVAKYNAGGALLWVKQAGGVSDDHGRGIAVDGSGNSYVTGYADASLFVAKYDAAGVLLWTKQADGVPTDDAVTVLGSGRGLDIGVDGNGNSYVTGSFTLDATFGLSEANETTLTSAGNFDIFMAKFEPAGTLLWAGRAGGDSDDHARGIAVDESGNSYVTGDFSGAATFGLGETQETTLTSAGLADIFVANFNPAGALLWVGRAGGALDDYGRGIGVDGSGNSYVTGDFQGSATFGATSATGLSAAQATETMLTSAGASDIFVARFGAATPLAVTLGYVYAALRDEAIYFQWQTATEAGTAGFNILTERPEGFAPLNRTLIPSKVIDSVTPTDYGFTAATDMTVFYLEEVNIEGARERHGPFSLGQIYGTMAEPVDPGGVEMQEQIYLPLLPN